MIPLYKRYQGEQLQIAELILRRRLQLLVHSYIYYDLDTNLISDETWSKWAVELKELQEKYPEIEREVPCRDGFENWNASTGAFLPYKTEQIRRVANRLLGNTVTKDTQIVVPQAPKKAPAKTISSARKKLF